MKPGEIGFDFDGVIADIGETFIRLACQNHGYCSIALEDISSFTIEDCLSIPPAVVEQIFLDILKDSIGTGLKPLPGALDGMISLGQHAPVTIITARPDIEPVHDWFDHYYPATARERIRLISAKDHDNKGIYIREQNLRYFVDDRLQTCVQLAETGIKSILFSQPWNRSGDDLPRVASWQELTLLFDFNSEIP
ncbi:MAG: hypothetical protein CR981_01955 [Proteobacteria bacterium]|nr:MAG: hypothetical protein CR981_01955 [Pseudomonadota bacterium]PIE65482.1 MAG: hypothetical protein CSA26_03730 [Desulfobacterales bacterium]